jgi:hypothetical protein
MLQPVRDLRNHILAMMEPSKRLCNPVKGRRIHSMAVSDDLKCRLRITSHHAARFSTSLMIRIPLLAKQAKAQASIGTRNLGPILRDRTGLLQKLSTKLCIALHECITPSYCIAYRQLLRILIMQTANPRIGVPQIFGENTIPALITGHTISIVQR